MKPIADSVTQQIAALSRVSDQPATASPAQRLLLGFKDRLLETAFLQSEFERSKRVIIIGLSIGTALMISLLWLDRFTTEPQAYDAVQLMRKFVAVPTAVIGLVGSILIKDVRIWILLVSVMTVLGGLRQSVVMYLTEGVGYGQLSNGIGQIMAVTFLLCGLPVRWATAVTLCFGLPFVMSSVLLRVSPTAIVSRLVFDFSVMFLVCFVATYRYEAASRRRFIALAASQIDWSRRLAAETDRNRWLQVIAAFLKHELNSKFAGLYSSLDFAKASHKREDIWKFHDRARRSATAMDFLLTQVADATNLEAALVPKGEMERIDLSELVADQAALFSESYRRDFAVDSISPSVHVMGSPQALLLLVDKLFGNAIEHGAAVHPIRVEVSVRDGWCVLLVSDVGDALPADAEHIFEPFVSRKSRRVWGGNLGLGLYVARTIAVHHGGTVTAEPLAGVGGATGAAFTVRLPLADAAAAPAVTAPSGSRAGGRS